MKTVRYAVMMFIVCSLSLMCENDIRKVWETRKETLMKDPSVLRYYTFEGVVDSKSVVKDLSGKGGDLRYVPVKVSGKEIVDLQVVEGRVPGKPAVRLDRGYYQGPGVDIENKAFTAECWFRRKGPVTEYPDLKVSPCSTILVCGDGGVGWFLGLEEGSKLSGRISCVPGSVSDGKEKVYIEAQARDISLPLDSWQYAAFTWDGKEIFVYLNGLLVARAKHDGEYVPAAGSPLFVGYHTKEILDIDEVVIYNRALSTSEIKQSAMIGEEQLAIERVKGIFSDADKLIEKGNYTGARKTYEKLKDISGISYGTQLYYFNTADSYVREKKYKQAIDTYDELLKVEGLSTNYRVYGLFSKADVYSQQGQYKKERQVYTDILKITGISDNDIMRVRRGIGDSYCKEKKYSTARQLYEGLLAEVSCEENPNEIHRLELIDRLESIDGLKDGQQVINEGASRQERINRPVYAIYVSPGGNDSNEGTKDRPFATIGRAQQEVRSLIKGKGLPEKGIVVYLRGGRYFLQDSVIFTKEDSGTEERPVVYRSYPGEEVRLIGGREVPNFKPLTDEAILRRLPEESRGKVWVADLKELGITEYGELKNRGYGTPQAGGMELIYNGNVMPMSRYPNEGWLRVADLVDPAPEWVFRDTPYDRCRFKYSGNRPERWTEEDDVWLKGYLGPRVPYIVKHAKVTSIDTKNKIIYVAEDPRWKDVKDPADIGSRISKGGPYFAYNLLSEIDMPGEWYLDRKSGRLYFWPVGDNIKGETIVSTFDKPIVEFKDTSHMVLYKLTIEGTWRTAIEMTGGENNLIAGCVIRNTGQWAGKIHRGWAHAIVGCDMYDLGEGGIELEERIDYNLRYRPALAPERRRKLIPTRHLAENNHIYRFNRLCGGNNAAINISGIGQRVSHNLINDTPHYAVNIGNNNHILEFNEIHDVVAHSRELGAIYTWDGAQCLTFRGNILKNNFLHHITGHYSPNPTHGCVAVHIDGISANVTLSGNILFRTNGISSSAPDCRFENNIFIKCSPGLDQGNRSALLENDGKLERWGYDTLTVLKRVDYKLLPWSIRYPQLTGTVEGKNRPFGWPKNVTIERNVNTAGTFITIGRGLTDTIKMRQNMKEGDPLFVNPEKNDFRLRPGSPAYDITGMEPVPFEKIGLYNDQLRASWPVVREIGKYFDPSKETARVKPKEYLVNRRTSDIKIDGKLEKDEWLGLDTTKAIVLDKYYTASQNEQAPKSYIWMVYDDRYLYIGIEHTPDPWTEDMPVNTKKMDWTETEVSIEGQVGSDTTGWWLPDMATGPIYILRGFGDGRTEIMDSYCKMPESLREELMKQIEYAVVMHDKENFHWTSEWKIPFSLLGINPKEVESRRFNIGVLRRKNWVGWIYTNKALWKLEDGGRIRFVK